ncbi:transcription factor [Ganoderma sinense ZZ0214-1]|uniref:Transcription factor n=1 Tax=Ganoderma sinense ZZ0214-1 TaxID=1077348 RepID=A0A2G8SGG0_9APHY|nr:transcription factor [Ganoderma sinense ZZ0214-1]
MSHRDQHPWLPGECILSKNTLPSPAAPSSGVISEPPSRRFESKARATSRKSKDRDRVKPPANGFLLFRSEYVSNPANQISTDGSRKRQVDLTREAGIAWRHLFQEQRDIYRETARRNMEAHKTRHPDYWTSRRGKDGKFARADPKREQGSSVKVSHGEHEAVLSVDPRSQSAFAPTAAGSPSSTEDAASPCPSLSSSVSDDMEDCRTPRPSCESESQQSFLSVTTGSSPEQPSFGGLEPYPFYDFIDESQFLSADVSPVPPWWFSETSLRTDMAASKEFQKPDYGVSYEDWAFTEGEDFFVDGARALGGLAISLAGFWTSEDAPLAA